jgi:two-component system sensor histidine kinase YesM
MSTERKMFRDELENIFIAYALIPTLIFSIIFYSFFIFNHVRTIKSNNKKNNQNVAEVLEHEFIKYENEINSLIKNPSILDTLAYNNDKTSAYEYLYDFVNTRELGSLFYLFDNEGELLLTNSWEKESRLSGINEAKQKNKQT